MEDPEYKLITCVDPRKVNVPIRDRFAKLTLSNKKKNEQMTETGQRDFEKPTELCKCVSASRNILQMLDNTTRNVSVDECITPIEEIAPPIPSNFKGAPHYLNPLLWSESSGSVPEKKISSPQLGKYGGFSTDHTVEYVQSEDMEPLQISEYVSQVNGENKMDQEITKLTSRVSAMTVNIKGFNSNASNGNVAHEANLLVSAESQRMSGDMRTCRPQTHVMASNEDNTCFNIITSKDLECISLSSDGSGSAITISDTATSEFMDFDVMISDIPQSGGTADALLPNTLSNEKADRMEAFLRDVSQQRKEMNEHCEVKDVSTLLITDDETSSHIFQNSQIRKEGGHHFKHMGELADADTESMTTFSTDQCRKEEGYDNILELNISKEKIAIKHEPETENDNTLSTSQNHSTNFIGQKIIENFEDSQRLAHDETQVNTCTSQQIEDEFSQRTSQHDSEQYQQGDPIKCSEISFTSNGSKLDIPEESVVISETSSESEHSTSSARSSGSKEVLTSEPIRAPSTDDMQIQMAVGSINISAKINIKISISETGISEDEDGDEQQFEDSKKHNVKNGENCANENDHQQISTSDPICDQQCLQRSKIEPTESTSDGLFHDTNSEDAEEDTNFLTHAERLLNQVYGHTWKTPDVIRTLKRTNCTPNKVNCTPTLPKYTLPISPTEMKKTCNEKSMEYEKSVEQSTLDDFSIFRRDIVRTNLDSTRFVTPKTQHDRCSLAVAHGYCNTEPRSLFQHNEQQNCAEIPKTEVKRNPTTKLPQNVTTAAERWRQLVDDDSETSGDNASDDDTLDKSGNIDSDKYNKENYISEFTQSQTSNSTDDNGITQPIKGMKRMSKKKHQLIPLKKREGSKTRFLQSKHNLVYLDLSKNEVTIQDAALDSPPANNDVNFNKRLEDILRTCKANDKARLVASPATSSKSKRKLFTANFGDEDVDLTVGEDGVQPRTPIKPIQTREEELLQEMDAVKLNDGPSSSFAIFNKHLEAIKRGNPIFTVTPPRIAVAPKLIETPTGMKTTRILREKAKLTDQLCATPTYKYGFLKSLDVCVTKSFCHPDALPYRENYRTKKEELARLLYELYNERLFENKLNVLLQWNKKLCNTAGRCLNKKRLGKRSCIVELSEKVLTSADRLRCTLIHELCHAATWIFSGEGGHGSTWKQWAQKANSVFPEIPKIGVCHQYDIEYKYTYKCTLCAAKSHAHSKSKKVENVRCAFCHGAIEVFLNKKDKEGNIMPTPVREPTGFAKFVKDNYKQYKRPDLKHAHVMRILSTEFAAMKTPSSGN